MMKPKSRPGQSGYTLIEMLVVVTIIGILSLISVPAFTTYFRSAKLKAAVRQFASDCRAARAQAISGNKRTAIGVRPSSSSYAYFERNSDGASPPNFAWVQRSLKTLDESVTFQNTAFPNVGALDDGFRDVIFDQNGTVRNMASPPTIILKSRYRIQNNVVTFTFNTSGSFTTAFSTDWS